MGRWHLPGIWGKYKSNECQGFCNVPVVDLVAYNIEGVFPKVAALGGTCRDARVPKGWILFR
jgi:hypothetical protein